MKALRLFAPLLAAALVLSGCGMIKVNPERDGAQIVAEVNGEKITKKDVYDACNVAMDQKVERWEKASFNSYKEQVLEQMIAGKVTLLKARDAGMYTFTADEQKQIDDDVAAIYQDIYDEALAEYQEQAKTDPSINPEEKAMADVDAQLAEEGTSRDELRKQAEDGVAYEKLYKSITDSVTPSDSDLQTGYSNELSSQQTQFDADASAVISTENDYGSTILYYPNDTFFRVRQILIPIPDEIENKIKADRQLNTDEANQEADQLRDDALKTLLDKANEALTKAKDANGDLAKLDQLIKDLGDNDPSMDAMPDGYLAGKDSTDDYVKEWIDAANALTKIGQPSELVATDYGYHILWVTKRIAKGAVPFDQVKDKLTETVKAAKQQEAWNKAVSGWIYTDYKSKIQRYLGRLKS